VSAPIHSCGTMVVDAHGLRLEPDHDPTADWYCPACRAYFGDQELDVFDGTWSVETCQECPFMHRVNDGHVRMFACKHPGAPGGYASCVDEDKMGSEPPGWCPLREGPTTIRLTRPRSGP